MVLQRLLAFVVTRGILVCLVQIGHIIMYVLNSRNMLFWSVTASTLSSGIMLNSIIF